MAQDIGQGIGQLVQQVHAVGADGEHDARFEWGFQGVFFGFAQCGGSSGVQQAAVAQGQLGVQQFGQFLPKSLDGRFGIGEEFFKLVEEQQGAACAVELAVFGAAPEGVFLGQQGLQGRRGGLACVEVGFGEVEGVSVLPSVQAPNLMTTGSYSAACRLWGTIPALSRELLPRPLLP